MTKYSLAQSGPDIIVGREESKRRYKSQNEPGTKPGTLCFKRYSDRGTLAGNVWIPRIVPGFLLDQISSGLVVLHLMATPDTVIVLCTSILSPLLYINYLPNLSMNLTWSAVGIAIVFPLQNSIKDAFSHRESSLQALGDFRATLIQVFLANMSWDWPGNDGWYGRAEDNVPKEQGGKGVKPKKNTPLPQDHTKRVHDLMLQMLDLLQELLMIPRRGRARQEYCQCLSSEKAYVEAAEIKGRNSVMTLITRLHGAVEDLKLAGMPANEASRINQYNMMLCKDFEKLWSFKTYRTATSLRAVVRVTLQFLPFLYGPYYVHMARSTRGENSGKITIGTVVFACFFASFVSLLMVALFNVAVSLENPFRPDCLDTIRVQEELDLTRESLAQAVRDKEMAWHERLLCEWEVVKDNNVDEESSEEDDDDV